MFKRYLIGIAILTTMLICTDRATAQFDDDLFPERGGSRKEENEKIKEMLSKQQAEHDKKDHEELLKNGEHALDLSLELEKSFENHPTLSPEDKKKLESLEKLATKIRNELGGDDDGDDNKEIAAKTSTLGDSFKFLQTTTSQLMDELKKTTRFSISAAAIETSNTLIKIARVLRLRN